MAAYRTSHALLASKGTSMHAHKRLNLSPIYLCYFLYCCQYGQCILLKERIIIWGHQDDSVVIVAPEFDPRTRGQWKERALQAALCPTGRNTCLCAAAPQNSCCGTLKLKGFLSGNALYILCKTTRKTPPLYNSGQRKESRKRMILNDNPLLRILFCL